MNISRQISGGSTLRFPSINAGSYSAGLPRAGAGRESRQAEQAQVFIGAPVQTSKGEDVAWVNDLVIDFAKDQVVYSVLSDVGGMQGKMVAVPFSELSKKGDMFTLHATREKLEEAPAFTWNDTTDLRYAESIYRYYGVQPYWEEK